ncbi:general substrate transporter [Aspergillus karnatakaensis]|uniref:general substrate transporter n=1 Tax=Aspergillus karnatakaensis TaxID=1810916 RepID=UPI003CCE4A8A
MEFFERTWRPHVPGPSKVVIGLLMACATITSATVGFDASMMNGLNILPSYTEYFSITTITKGLSASATYIGGILAGLVFPHIVDKLSRRTALLLAASVTIGFIAIQAASQPIAMFIALRIGLGFGKSCTIIVAPTYLAETFPYKYRGWGLGLINDFYYVGALITAGVTYRTAEFNSTWAWRTPSLLQGFWSLLCISVLPFIPESPRWLISQGRYQEALKVLAQVNSDGDESHASVVEQHREIMDAMERDDSTIGRMKLREIVRSRSVIRRLSLVFSCALATVIVASTFDLIPESSWCTDVEANSYFGTMLENAGITDSTTQLQIILGTYLYDKLGRRLSALLSTTLLTLFLYLIGILIRLYGTSTHKPGIYGAVACMFLFMGSYSLSWTPLCYLYPPEVFNYPIRAQGMGLNTWTYFSFGLVFVFSFPFALETLGWKAYVMNASWNWGLIVFIYFYWVETAGKTLEEIDAIFEGDEGLVTLDAVEGGKEDEKI